MNALLSNPFKEGLRKGDTQIGLWLSLKRAKSFDTVLDFF